MCTETVIYWSCDHRQGPMFTIDKSLHNCHRSSKWFHNLLLDWIWWLILSYIDDIWSLSFDFHAFNRIYVIVCNPFNPVFLRRLRVNCFMLYLLYDYQNRCYTRWLDCIVLALFSIHYPSAGKDWVIPCCLQWTRGCFWIIVLHRMEYFTWFIIVVVSFPWRR